MEGRPAKTRRRSRQGALGSLDAFGATVNEVRHVSGIHVQRFPIPIGKLV
jgi:hypothetical protein